MMEEDRVKEYENALIRVRSLKLGDPTKMWIEYDKQNDILNLVFGDEEPDESIMLDDDIVLSLKDDTVVGISIYNFSKKANI